MRETQPEGSASEACCLSGVRFSVVIAAFNASRTIASSIRSVLQQTEQNFEVIVVDDGSTDDTAECARSFASDPRVRVITQRNQGPSVARNAGIAAGEGLYVSMLDADDLWLPEYLLVMGEALDAEPHAAFAYTDAWLVDDKTKKIRRTSVMFYESPPTTPLPDERTFFLRLLEGNFVHNSVTLRRSVLDEVGGCDESLRVCQDYELWLRIAARGMPAVRPPGLLAIYRSNPASLSGDMRRVIPDLCEIYRRFADDPTADAEVRAVAQRQLAHWTRRLQLLEKPTFASRVRMHAFLAKRRLMSPWLWLRRRPEAVERTLRAVGEIG